MRFKLLLTLTLILSSFSAIRAQFYLGFDYLAYSVLDGESVYLYVDPKVVSIGESNSAKGIENASGLVYQAERDFRSNNPWRAIHNLSRVTKEYKHVPPERMDSDLLQIVSRAYSSAGILFHHLGNFPQALKETKRGLMLREERFGRKHFITLNSMNNLAALYRDMGKFEQSEALINEVIDNLELIHREKNIEYAIAINNRSMLYYSVGRIDDAFLDNNLAQQKALELLREKNRDFFPFMVNEAILQKEKGNLDKAEEILIQIKQIKQRRLGKKKPEYARAINHLAALKISRGDFDGVEDMLNDAYKIYQKQFGDNHPATAKILANRGLYYLLNKKHSSAIQDLESAIRIQSYIMGKYHPDFLRSKSYLSSAYEIAGRTNDANKVYNELNSALMEQIKVYLPAMSEQEKAKFWAKSVPYVLNYYGFVGSSKKAQADWTKQLLETHWQTKGTLLSSSKQLKQAVLSTNNIELQNTYEEWLEKKSELLKYYSLPKKEVFSLGIKFDALENEINALEKQLNEGTNISINAAENINFSAVQSKLKNGEVLVEIIKAQRNFLFDNKASYLAAFVYPDKDPVLVNLGADSELEGRYLKYYKNTITYKITDKKSYGVYWSKIAPQLVGQKTVFVSAEGVYNQVSLNTLQDPNNGEFVLNKYRVENVSSGKALLKPRHNEAITSAFLIGSPDFGDKGTLAPLPGTEQEINQINSILRNNSVAVDVSLGKEANESKMKQVNSPSLVHVATHGFFEKDEKNSGNMELDFDGIKQEKNPLLKSGILLTDAENGLAKTNSDAAENGILTAYEAMDLNLQNTELVVLSACETGLGDNVVGEGVYGLQRAFQIAGASATITSLWKVNDAATQDLMSTFMDMYLETNDKAVAFRQAQIALAKKYNHPYYWGAFVMLN